MFPGKGQENGYIFNESKGIESLGSDAKTGGKALEPKISC